MDSEANCEISQLCIQRVADSGAPASWNKLLRRFRANTAKRRGLRKELKPIRDEIVLAGFLRSSPGADESLLRGLLEDRENAETVDFAELEESEDQDIAFLLDRNSDYKKRQVRRLAIEPFLCFLEKQNIKPSRRYPLNRMVAAWLDWLNVEKRLRPTDTGVRTIVADMKAHRSKAGSKAHRRRTKTR
jgi:hypothetical protein